MLSLAQPIYAGNPSSPAFYWMKNAFLNNTVNHRDLEQVEAAFVGMSYRLPEEGQWTALALLYFFQARLCNLNPGVVPTWLSGDISAIEQLYDTYIKESAFTVNFKGQSYTFYYAKHTLDNVMETVQFPPGSFYYFCDSTTGRLVDWDNIAFGGQYDLQTAIIFGTRYLPSKSLNSGTAVQSCNPTVKRPLPTYFSFGLIVEEGHYLPTMCGTAFTWFLLGLQYSSLKETARAYECFSNVITLITPGTEVDAYNLWFVNSSYARMEEIERQKEM
jgi:hypothetical protein